MMDPREAVIAKRLSAVTRVIGFFSAKGGVGKTMCTALAGCVLAARGKRVGILDVDMQGASTHIVLGAPRGLPAEDKGILPVRVMDSLSLMSAAAFTGERALALRGADVSDAIRELLAVTQWGALDYLLFDMPPGIGDEVLDCALLVPRIEAVVVSTSSALSISVVERLLAVLGETHIAVPGLLATMTRGDAGAVSALAVRAGVPYGGAVPFEPELELAIGHTGRLLATGAAHALGSALATLGIGDAP